MNNIDYLTRDQIKRIIGEYADNAAAIAKLEQIESLTVVVRKDQYSYPFGFDVRWKDGIERLIPPTDSGMILFADSSRGVTIPQHWLESINPDYWDTVTPWAREAISAGPENDDYWHAWEQVMESQHVKDVHGNEWTLYMDGDLWLVCHELMTRDECEGHGFDYVYNSDDIETLLEECSLDPDMYDVDSMKKDHINGNFDIENMTERNGWKIFETVNPYLHSEIIMASIRNGQISQAKEQAKTYALDYDYLYRIAKQ